MINEEISTLETKIDKLERVISDIHIFLDEQKAPWWDKYGKPYSLVGRIQVLLDTTIGDSDDS